MQHPHTCFLPVGDTVTSVTVTSTLRGFVAIIDMLVQSVFGKSLFTLLLHVIYKEIMHVLHFIANASSPSIFASSEGKY